VILILVLVLILAFVLDDVVVLYMMWEMLDNSGNYYYY
jgi:hypothetical protein